MLELAFDTNQISRTFQDRSYVFRVERRPDDMTGATIWNLNTRGRRGNMYNRETGSPPFCGGSSFVAFFFVPMVCSVQTYPATEYDFAPNPLTVAQGDYVHIQFHSSDFNQAQANNGEGWRYSDASNMVQMETLKVPAILSSSKQLLFVLSCCCSDRTRFPVVCNVLGQLPHAVGGQHIVPRYRRCPQIGFRR